jgi:1-acyl-sn-glycerol-3-phosphate acyltransferase
LLTPRKSLFLSLRNVYETLAVSAPTVVDAVRGRITREVCDARLESWASHVIRNAEIMVTVHGRENLATGKTYVLMSNHQSHYDVPVLYYVLGSNIRMVAKKELFKVPVFGRAMREAGFVEVDRGNREKAIDSLKEAKRHLEAGTHIWIAPEGTRSETGALGEFKKGGFIIAQDMQAPIMPITIQGTREVLRAHGARSRRGVEVHVTIHPAIDTRAYASMDRRSARDALMAEVRRAIGSGL